MKCIIPKNSGFCFGVALAVDSAYKNAGKSAYMYGEVVHNPLVVNDLISRGLTLINDLNEIPPEEKAKILIRAHGVPKGMINEINSRALEIIDKTCPRVKKIHEIVCDASGRGLNVIIVGKPNHPEVNGIIGWCSTNYVLIDSIDDVKKQPLDVSFFCKGICMVSQTTHNKKIYEKIYTHYKSFIENIEFHNTICDATANRQNEIRELAQTVNAVIVVGGKKSSNVTKLYEIASEYCNLVLHIEDEKQLDYSTLEDINILAIVSGASTPSKSVDAVLNGLSEYCNSNNIKFEIERL